MKRSLKTDSLLASKRVTSEYFEPLPEQRRSKRTGLLGNCDVPVIPIESKKTKLQKTTAKGRRKSMKLLADQEDEPAMLSRQFHTTGSESALAKAELVLKIGAQRFRSSFYDVPCQDLAKKLLGTVLVRRLADGTTLRGMIVETECYLGGEDKASHSFNGRVTERCKPMYMKPGTAYVYMTYGMYHCFNISSQEPGAAVLLRALEPLDGLDEMLAQRMTSRKKPKVPANDFSAALENSGVSAKRAKRLKTHELCNGPAKLCTSLSIEKSSCNTQDLCDWPGMWIERPQEEVEVMGHHIVKTSRVGIDSAGMEWATKPLRFYLLDKPSVSRRDLAAEKELREIAALLR